jgi:nitrous oxidase accessory protein
MPRTATETVRRRSIALVALAAGAWLLLSPRAQMSGSERAASEPGAARGTLPTPAASGPLRPGARSIVVSPDGDIRTVAGGIAAARDGDRVVVRQGVYREPMIVVDRSVEIVGEGWPVLDGQGARQILAISADSVVIRGLRFRDVGVSMIEDRAAIKVAGARGCRIEDNVIENGFFGIYLQRAEGCVIARNVMTARGTTQTGSGNGVHSYASRDITVEDNRITGYRDGIYLEFSRVAQVRGNESERNLRYGLHFMYSDSCLYEGNTFGENSAGVAVMYSRHVEMLDNDFRRNWGSASYGLLLKEVYDVRLADNRFDRNTVGVFADGAVRIVADGNSFTRNGWAIKLMASTTDGSFTRNDFVANTFDVSTNSRRTENTFAGNFWDQYAGYDLDRDGSGDVPHRPVRLFSLIVEENAPATIVLRSFFVGLLDNAERVIPALTPLTLVDATPSMRRNR